jgi:hypothetical protein
LHFIGLLIGVDREEVDEKDCGGDEGEFEELLERGDKIEGEENERL